MRYYQRLLFVFNFSIFYPILYNRFHVKDKFFIHVLNVLGSFRVGNIFRLWKICIHCCTMIKAFMWKNFRETLHGIYWVYVSMFKGKYTEHYFLIKCLWDRNLSTENKDIRNPKNGLFFNSWMIKNYVKTEQNWHLFMDESFS